MPNVTDPAPRPDAVGGWSGWWQWLLHRRPSLRRRQGAAPTGPDSGDRRRSPPRADRPPVAAHGGAGCEEYCEREVDELEFQGGRIYLHLKPPGRPTARL